MSFRPADPSTEEQCKGHRKALKRLVKGNDAPASSQPNDKTDRLHGSREATPSDLPRPKTGLKLKIKFTGAARKIEVVNNTLPDGRLVELGELCLPDDQWLRESPQGWRSLRESPQPSSSLSAEQERLEVAQQPLQEPEHLPEVHPDKRRRIEASVQQAAPAVQDAVAVGALELAANKGESWVAEAIGMIDTGGKAARPHPEARQTGSSAAAVDATARTLAGVGDGKPAAEIYPEDDGDIRVGAGGSGDMGVKPDVLEAEARAARDNCTRIENPRASPEQQRPPKGVERRLSPRERYPQPASVRTMEEMREENCERERREVDRRGEHERRREEDRRREEEKRRSQDQEQKQAEEHRTSTGQACERKSPPVVEEKEPGEASSESSSESSDSSSSSSSGSETSSADSRAELQRKRSRSRSASPSKSRSRSREPGEHSDSEERPRKQRYFARSRSRSRSPGYRREHDRERSRYYSREEERRYERARYERSRRFSRDPGDRRHEREHDRRESDRRYRERDARDSRRTQSRTPEVQVPKDRARTRAPTRERSPRPLSRLGDPSRATKSQALKGAIKEPHRLPGAEAARKDDGQAQSDQAEGCHKAGQQPQAEAFVQVFGFADAWNMLYGSASEDFGSEADMETLRNEATKAKHDIDSAAKANSGKHTLANLVVLMRDSFLKYMQVCAIWETLLRLPAVPPTRTRAKLADDGGMYPCTIKLMRQISTDARVCNCSPEAGRILRVLAERLVAVMHMRLVQVQRGKLHQDRQILLACTGAPACIDSYGRIIPGATDAPGETFQRPSPTDSNASNSTGELSVNPSPGRSARPAAAPVKTPPPARALPKPSSAIKGLPNTTQQGKVSKVAKGGKGGQKTTHQGTPTRGASTNEEAAKGGSKPASRMPVPTGPGRDDAWTVQPPAWEIAASKAEHVTRSWSLLGGVTSFTGQFRAHFEETGALMQSRSPLVKEAAAMLGFLDVGLGLSNMGLVLQLSRNILELVLKIDAAGAAPLAQPSVQ